MARVDVALNGTQVPNEHIGPPRITRLLNCKFDNGVIKKTPGTVAIPTTTEPAGYLSRPITFGLSAHGVPLCLSKHSYYGFLPVCVFTGEDDNTGQVWRTGSAANPTNVEFDECPRVFPVFTNQAYHYENPGVVKTSATGVDSEYIVVAQALPDWGGNPVVFGAAHVVWAKIAGSSRVVMQQGEISGITLPANYRPHLTCARDSQFIAYYSSTTKVSIRKWDATIQSFIQVALVTAPTGCECGNRTNIDLSYDADHDRLLLLWKDGHYTYLNATSGATLHSGTLSLAVLAHGTLAAGLDGSGSGSLAYVAFRDTDYIWYGKVFSFTDANVTVVAYERQLCASPNGWEDPPGFMWQAGVTPFVGGVLGVAAGAFVALWWKPKVTGELNKIYGTVRGFSASGIIGQNTAGFDMFSAVPACAPVAHYPVTLAAPDEFYATIWGYTHSRILQNAIRLGQTRSSYTCPGDSVMPYKMLPRITATAFRGGACPPTPSPHITGHLNHSMPCYLPPFEHGVMRRGLITAVIRMKSALLDTGACDVYVIEQVEGDTALDTVANVPDTLQLATARDSVLVSSSLTGQCSIRGEDSGHQYPPWAPTVSSTGVGINPPEGLYSYVVVREWTDSAGNVHRSPPSDPVNLNHTGGAIEVKLYDDPWQQLYLSSRLRLYRTKAAGTVYYEVTNVSGNGFGEPAITAFDSVTISDTTVDSAIGANAILYTQADHGGLSGMLETWGAPGCRCIWGGSERAIAGGLESPNRVRFSNIFFPGEGVSWPENAAFFVDLPEPVTAVACLNGTWIAASNTSIWAITGQGPDAFGSGTFDTPRIISSGIGIRSWRSVVETPAGLYFQSSDGQIYLLQTGSFSVALASSAIRDSVDQYPEYVGTTTAQENRFDDPSVFAGNYVRAAVYFRETREVWFALYWGKCWVLSLDTNSWRTETDATMRTRITIGGGLTRVKVQRYPNSDYVSVVVPSFVQAEDSGTLGTQYPFRAAIGCDSTAYLGYEGDVRPMAIYSNDIDLNHGRIRKVWMTLRREQSAISSEYTVKSRFGIWYDGLRSSEAPQSVLSTLHNSTAANTLRFMDLEFCPARQKCNSFKFYWQDDPTTYPELSWIITGISVDVEGFDRKQQRIPTVARGT